MLEDRPDGAFHPVGREEVLCRQDARKDRRICRKEKGLPHAQDERTEGQMPELQDIEHRQQRHRGDHSQIGPLHADDEQPLGKAVGGDATCQHKSHQSDAGGSGHQRQFQRAASQMDDLVDHRHGPHAGSENGNRQSRDQHPEFPVCKGAQRSQGGHFTSLNLCRHAA